MFKLNAAVCLILPPGEICANTGLENTNDRFDRSWHCTHNSSVDLVDAGTVRVY
jgi:hypothetical protein